MGPKLPSHLLKKTVLLTVLYMGMVAVETGIAQSGVSPREHTWYKLAEASTYSIASPDSVIAKDKSGGTVLPTNLEKYAPPLIAFSSASVSATEGETVDLLVELVEAGERAVTVDIVFVDSLSTAAISDIGNYATRTIDFSGVENSGTVKKLSVDIDRGSGIEGTERAVFQLRNNSAGSLVEPRELILTITEDSPDVVVNEFLTDPPAGISGDANNDQNSNKSEDEFVEVVNSKSEKIDISGWQLSNNKGNRIVHTFPEGTVLPASGAVVVFGGGKPAGNFGNANVQISSEGELDFADDSGTISLLDEGGQVVQQVSYDQRKERSRYESLIKIDGKWNEYVGHSEAALSNNSLYSPGTRADGSVFGTDYATRIQGGEGWRLISSPSRETTFEDLFKEIHTQGISGSDLPGAGNEASIRIWDEKKQRFVAPSSMTEKVTAGRGYAVYFFKEDNIDVQNNFSKKITSRNSNGLGKADPPETVSVRVTVTDRDGDGVDGKEGWNLLGNPFGTEISVDALFSVLEDVNESVNKNIYVWNPEKNGAGGYEIYSPGDGKRLLPYQAFWVRYTKDGIDTEVTFKKENLTEASDASFLKNNSSEFGFSLELNGEGVRDVYEVRFSENGSVELDQHDGFKLFSLNPKSIHLYSILSNRRLAKNILPRDLKSTLEIPIYYDPSENGTLRFTWENISAVPAEWDLILVDQKNNKKINLRSNPDYRFDVTNSEPANVSSSEKKVLLQQSQNEEGNDRFMLSIQPSSKSDQTSQQMPESVKLNPNYPNPFTNSTTIPFELSQEAEVTLTIWNMIGQKVATLVDGVREAGDHNDVRWNASNMPSGMYIARFEVNGEVYTRKLTLIK